MLRFRPGLFGRPLVRPGAAAEQPADPRQQDRELGRLGQVVVGAGGEAVQHVLGTAAGGQHQDRHEDVALAQLADDGEPVLAGQHDVEHDQVEVRRRIEKALEGAIAVVEHLGIEAFGLEVEAQPFGQVVLVFDDQDALRHADRAQADAGAEGSCSVKVLPCPWPALCA